MSYDVTIGGEWFNYTSNLRRFFKDFDVYPPDWAGKRRRQVAREIRHALKVIGANNMESLKAEYDPANNWGSVESAIRWLERIAEAGEARRSEMVEVSW